MPGCLLGSQVGAPGAEDQGGCDGQEAGKPWCRTMGAGRRRQLISGRGGDAQ